MRLLAVGDIHLGVRPSRLPEDLKLSARVLGPSEAWQRTVSAAIDHAVDAVLLAGDVVDRDDDFFEGYRELLKGLRQLGEAGIELLAVAGNHDVQVLPRIAAELPGFRLLGAGGQWERVELGSGSDRVQVWGWSFPAARVDRSPVTAQCIEPRPGINIGLLHCDLDSATSPYAPVRRSDLEALNLDAWLLGHIHRPSELSSANPIGYLGSLTGTDPGEPGAHGPWLITTDAGSIKGYRQIPLAPLRWEALPLDLSEAIEPADASRLLVAEARQLESSLADTPGLQAVGLRVVLTGSTSIGAAAGRILQEQAVGQVVFDSGSVHYFVEKVEVRTTPEIDLVALARQPNPAGILAARLLLLDRPDGDVQRQELLAEAKKSLNAVSIERRFSALQSGLLVDEDVVEYLRSAGFRLLEEMHLQVSEESS